MEMQMIHVNQKYIKDTGAIDEDAARNDADKQGFAIISLMTDVKEERMWGVNLMFSMCFNFVNYLGIILICIINIAIFKLFLCIYIYSNYLPLT